MPAEPILVVENLRVYYYTLRGVVRAVDGVDLEARPGELIGVVGESGSGKSTLGYSFLRLVPPPGRITGGRIIVDGVDMIDLRGEALRRARGELVSIVFQDPFTTLDPVRRIGDQIEEVLVEHGVPRSTARRRVEEVLESVGLPRDTARRYPHQLSGGQRQRVSIAAAIALRPRVLVADEPTTALDVVVQKQIMDLIDRLRENYRMAVILITHDIALAAERADRIAVMYAGKIVEFGPKNAIIEEPLHPYTRGLIASVPDITSTEWPKPIPGSPPDLRRPPKGCRFRPRCPKPLPECSEEPPLASVGGRRVACWLYSK